MIISISLQQQLPWSLQKDYLKYLITDSSLENYFFFNIFLIKAIQIPTISYEEQGRTNFTTFEELHNLLRKFFPKTFHYLQPKTINKHALLFKWEGQGLSIYHCKRNYS